MTGCTCVAYVKIYIYIYTRMYIYVYICSIIMGCIKTCFSIGSPFGLVTSVKRKQTSGEKQKSIVGG